MDDQGQPQLSFIDIGPGEDVYEYSVLATSLVEDLASFGQLYRDRGDASICTHLGTSGCGRFDSPGVWGLPG